MTNCLDQVFIASSHPPCEQLCGFSPLHPTSQWHLIFFTLMDLVDHLPPHCAQTPDEKSNHTERIAAAGLHPELQWGGTGV